MKTAVIIAAVMFGAGAPAFAADVTGKLVDSVCYAKEKAGGAKEDAATEEACAKACAQKGNPVALVTDKGEVYDVMAMGTLAGKNNEKLVPHMTHTVTLTGAVVDAKGKKTIHATALKMVSK